MNLEALDKYVGVLGKLKRHPAPGHGFAPHKPILLLALLDQIEDRLITDNFVVLTAELTLGFLDYWEKLVSDPHWQPKIEYPFRHLYQDGFWHFVADDQIVAPESKSYTINQLRASFDGVRLSPDLWLLLQDKAALDALRKHLLKIYFQIDFVPRESTQALVNAEAEKLKAESQGKFRIKKIKESNETGYFVRHALFPRVVKELYASTCCVCQAAARIPGRSGIVDAAHILPFAEFHYDDARNGLALCKNHHWGFDSGWFTITETYKVEVSPRLQNAVSYITAETEILLPQNALYYPEPGALRWHRQHVLLK